MLGMWMLACALAAQTGAGSSAATPAGAPGTPAGATGLKDMHEDKARLAIMSITAQGVPPEYAAGITETIATGIARTGVFDTISPGQVTSILAYEKRKDALGACVDDTCFAAVAQVVKADFLVGGSVAKVGEELVLNLILIDASKGTAANRAKQQTSNPSELVEQAYRTAIVALQPLLAGKQGYLKVTANAPEAAVTVNEERRAEGVGQAITLPGGPHVLRVSQDGFLSATADVMVQPGAVNNVRITLIPAQETIDSYETKATLMRAGAWTSTVLALGAGVLSAVMYHQATQDAQRVEDFVRLPDVDRTTERSSRALEAKSSFETEQGLYVAGLAGAVAFGGAALFLFLAGDDPDRYAEFHGVDD